MARSQGCLGAASREAAGAMGAVDTGGDSPLGTETPLEAWHRVDSSVRFLSEPNWLISLKSVLGVKR
uniref:Uncharacterized protein n=1 Tax=mine drainage metagenome TaxID=410659 RepID=E6PLS1_9ZZZZ